MTRLAFAACKLAWWLVRRIVKQSEVEFVLHGQRLLYYDIRWTLEDRRIVGRFDSGWKGQ
jgi:hypothetical protein